MRVTCWGGAGDRVDSALSQFQSSSVSCLARRSLAGFAPNPPATLLTSRRGSGTRRQGDTAREETAQHACGCGCALPCSALPSATLRPAALLLPARLAAATPVTCLALLPSTDCCRCRSPLVCRQRVCCVIDVPGPRRDVSATGAVAACPSRESCLPPPFCPLACAFPCRVRPQLFVCR